MTNVTSLPQTEIEALEKEALDEIKDEARKKAKSKIASKQREIRSAEQILKNLQNEYAVLLEEIRTGL